MRGIERRRGDGDDEAAFEASGPLDSVAHCAAGVDRVEQRLVPEVDHGGVAMMVFTADVDEVGFVGEDRAERGAVVLVPRVLEVIEDRSGDLAGLGRCWDGLRRPRRAHAATRSLRTSRKPVDERTPNQTTNPSPPMPNRGRASPAAIAGPAAQATSSRPAPT